MAKNIKSDSKLVSKLMGKDLKAKSDRIGREYDVIGGIIEDTFKNDKNEEIAYACYPCEGTNPRTKKQNVLSVGQLRAASRNLEAFSESDIQGKDIFVLKSDTVEKQTEEMDKFVAKGKVYCVARATVKAQNGSEYSIYGYSNKKPTA